MKISYNYLKSIQYLDKIDIEDIGNCVLEAFDDFYNKSYLIIKTVLGVSRIVIAGPFPSDGSVALKYNINFNQTDYDDRKVDRIIQKFIDSGDFTQILIRNISEIDDILLSFPNIERCMHD